MFIYNMLGAVALCATLPENPLYNHSLAQILLFTYPVTQISSIYLFVMSEPLYPVFIIQFIILLISIFSLDLLLKYNSREATQKRHKKHFTQKQKNLDQLITAERINIYLKYGKDRNNFIQTATTEEKTILSIEQWYVTDNLVNDVLLIKKGQVTQSTINSNGKRMKEKLRDQAAMDLLLTIE